MHIKIQKQNVNFDDAYYKKKKPKFLHFKSFNFISSIKFGKMSFFWIYSVSSRQNDIISIELSFSPKLSLWRICPFKNESTVPSLLKIRVLKSKNPKFASQISILIVEFFGIFTVVKLRFASKENPSTFFVLNIKSPLTNNLMNGLHLTIQPNVFIFP